MLAVGAGQTLTLTGTLDGSAPLNVLGPGTLILAGTSNYSGVISILGGTVQGNSSTLLGSIESSGAVIFDQTADGSYAGEVSLPSDAG